MILDFDDTCWTHDCDEWKRGLIELLVLLANRQQHALLAVPDLMLGWCGSFLHLHTEYFKTRLASAQVRANALRIRIAPNGGSQVVGAPPWSLTARAAFAIVNQPLRLVLENDQSDRLFVESTVPAFSTWCSNGWIEPVMGGGSHMKNKIDAASVLPVDRWRTFYLFDSDRLHPTELDANWVPPGGEACMGHVFERACVAMPARRWHQLERRSIENYLPPSLLATRNAATSAALFDASVGSMMYFYNFKAGLAGDGVHPPAPRPTVRASRSQGFWTALPAASLAALERGFGKAVAEEFNNVPANQAWPASVIVEMSNLSDALQDAI